MTTIPGLHHVTAISGAPQPNVDFFTGTLGQKLVKKTVNFDDPGTYHLYYGDAAGSPGTILTFFPFTDAGPGRAGPGMASAYAYAIPTAAFDRLTDDLAAQGLVQAGAELRFGERIVTLRDPDGAPVELIESADAADSHGFHSVTLWERDPERTLRLLSDVFGYQHIGTAQEGTTERHRLIAPGAERGRIIDVIRVAGAQPGRQGAGTIHHVAFRARDDAEQLDWMDRLAHAGHRTTEVKDRQYFNAIYFREPGGVLFEIATDPPGFAIDEPVDQLGQALKLPEQYEAMRGRIERVLPPLRVRS
ncbi:MAG: ring-cleaving dioxygenase [Pseudotabrizicola sp.]|uniref:ring-cleaving dioxygenase n=1 Tax=Pseudotabrizicola sp. TaxID=2939647 RepID=UPI002723F814|nr:ring-cleaving dioxygenase [Pseudotabrizicola sp.]MDO8883983.1 ring-cleaving dioxygenase [Pseudotabrizicola sp.]MDP2081005.1 ring-cleaving dioxygenase [Pseudotabrizicola sp.]MDZ7573637.1 ring-cleaving dioxygenase [Pseudotabrizicola sp.]